MSVADIALLWPSGEEASTHANKSSCVSTIVTQYFILKIPKYLSGENFVWPTYRRNRNTYQTLLAYVCDRIRKRKFGPYL